MRAATKKATACLLLPTDFQQPRGERISVSDVPGFARHLQ